jgi:sulfoacetaldehyde acetyltransferase
VLRELEKAMPADVMVSTDIGNINSVANSYLRFEKPRSFFAAMSFGNCGYACRPSSAPRCRTAPSGHRLCGRRRLGHEHDGNMTACATTSRDRRGVPQPPVGRGEEEPGGLLQPPLRRRRAGNQSFAGIAKAMGAEGIVVDQLEDVGPALKKAIDMQMNEGKTCVIEIMCTRELGDPFRRDALSKPVRMLDKYKDYV